ncbi:MAG: hypothetical protein Q7S52_01260 [bacterium]|nr:hypothetical protein [bacterium]
MDFYSILGWLGTILIVGAYWLNSTKRVESTSRAYQLMNLLGAIGVGFNVFHQAAWPAVTLQVIWGIIALYSLCSSLLKKKV